MMVFAVSFKYRGSSWLVVHEDQDVLGQHALQRDPGDQNCKDLGSPTAEKPRKRRRRLCVAKCASLRGPTSVFHWFEMLPLEKCIGVHDTGWGLVQSLDWNRLGNALSRMRSSISSAARRPRVKG